MQERHTDYLTVVFIITIILFMTIIADRECFLKGNCLAWVVGECVQRLQGQDKQ